MTSPDNEETRLRSVAMQNAQSINHARRRAEDALQKQTEWLRVTLSSIGDGVISTDAEGRVTFLNAVAASLTGWSEPEAMGRPLPEVFQIVNEQTRQPVENPAYPALREGVVVGLANHTVLIAKDGAEWPIDDSAAPIRDGDGKVVGCVLVFRDVTERRRGEQGLRESEARKTAMFEATLDSIISINHEGAITEFNATAERTFGYRRQDVLGRELAELIIPPEFRDRHRQGLLHYLATGEGPVINQRLELSALRADGSEFPVELTVTRIPVDGPPQFTAYLRDITERQIAETEQRELTDQLRSISAELSEANRRKDEFLAMLAHELRNPLAPIRNAVQIYHGIAPKAPELQWATEVIDRQVQQMTRLVDDLLDVSRITRGKIELRKERTEVATIMKSAVETNRPLIEKWGHNLTVTMPPQPIYLIADVTRLVQILSNLLNNAAKYTDQGGNIWLTADLENDGAVIRVKDSGIGITPAMLKRVFDMFTQEDRSLERAQGGLGIGLTLVQRLVEMHGGSVEARSDGPGTGSEFTVRLPVADECNQRTQKPGHDAGSLSALANRRILVVDDNHDAADSLGMLLRLMGNDVHTAHDGMEAVLAAGTFRPNVVLLDIGLPKLNGYEVAKRIRTQNGGGKIVLIALTGWGQDEDRRRSQEAGFDYHMTKPVEFETLQRVLMEFQAKRGAVAST